MKMQWFKDHTFDIIGMILTILGICVTFFGLYITESKDSFTIYLAFLSAETIVTVAWILTTKNKYDLESDKNSIQVLLDEEISKNKKLYEQIENLTSDYQAEINNRNNKVNESIEKILLNFKNSSKLYNESCNRIPGLSESSYEILSTLSELPNMPIDNSKKIIKQSQQEYVDGLFRSYNSYTSHMLDYSIIMISNYLKIIDIKIDISITVKLFNKPYCVKTDDRDDIIVYTAFRDKKTYESNEREIGQEKYTIEGNVDFLLCLTKENYIINNARKGDSNYSNEHKDFDAYYNSTVVVPIRIKLQDQSFKIFGYFCCDCLNTDYDKVFDKRVANIMYALAQQYAIFLETIDSNWRDRFGDNTNSYLPIIFEKICKK